MASEKIQAIVEAVKGLSILELSELVKAVGQSLAFPQPLPEPLPPLPTAELTWEIVDGELVLEWTGGTLEVSDQADTGWVAIRQASPLVVPLSETTGSKFYRLAQ